MNEPEIRKERWVQVHSTPREVGYYVTGGVAPRLVFINRKTGEVAQFAPEPEAITDFDCGDEQQ